MFTRRYLARVELTRGRQDNLECAAYFLLAAFPDGFWQSLSLSRNSHQSPLQIVWEPGQQICTNHFTLLHRGPLTNGLAEVSVGPGQLLQLYKPVVGIDPDKLVGRGRHLWMVRLLGPWWWLIWILAGLAMITLEWIIACGGCACGRSGGNGCNCDFRITFTTGTNENVVVKKCLKEMFLEVTSRSLRK